MTQSQFQDAEPVRLSVVIPVRDEEENLVALYEATRKALDARPDLDWELIVVDDGSRDASRALIGALGDRDSRVRGLQLARPSGQSSALFAGVGAARGDLIATLDADLQNDPEDLLRLVDALGDHDAVAGYRVGRQDDWIRRLSSRVANGLRNRVTGDRVTDTGCSLKVFRADALRALPSFEGMHRFLPTLLRMAGRRVIELPVRHHPRRFGRSKYGISNRALRTALDLLAVRWMKSRTMCTEFHRISRSA